MGYTHYWTTKRVPTDEEWTAFVADCNALRGGPGSEDTPETVRIDGDCETFVVDRHRLGFDFCKTRQAAYDDEVTACLLALKRRLGDAVRVSSDGHWREWVRGRDLFTRTFGVPAEKAWLRDGEDEEDDR